MSEADNFWIPLVDEPIGTIVAEAQGVQPEIEELIVGARRTLAFRTFAYIRVGMLLGQLLVDHDDAAGDAWIERLLEDPANRAAVEQEVLAVAREIAADDRYGGDESAGPDDETRRRFREFARKQLG